MNVRPKTITLIFFYLLDSHFALEMKTSSSFNEDQPQIIVGGLQLSRKYFFTKILILKSWIPILHYNFEANFNKQFHKVTYLQEDYPLER